MTRRTTLGKFIVTIAAMLMAVSYAPGDAVAEEPLELSIWTLFSGGEGYIMTNLIEQFNQEHQDIHITEAPLEWGAYYDQLLAGLLTGPGPDIAIMHLSILPTYAEKGILAPVEKYVSEEFRSQFLSNIATKMSYNHHVYAIPIDTHPYVLYYNTSVLKEAGLMDTSGKVQLPSTWEELLEYANTIKEKTGKWGLTIESQYSGERWWMSLYRQSGGLFFDPDTSTLQLDAEHASEAYEVMKSFYTRQVTPFIPDYAECEHLFLDQQSGFHINGVWGMAVYPDTEELDFGVTSIPALQGSQAYAWGDSHAFVFPEQEDQEKLNAALAFAKWFSKHSIDWAKAGHLPANKKVLNSQAVMRLPMREEYVQIGKHVVLAPSVQGWDDMRRFLWDLGEKVTSNLIPIEKAVDVLQNKVSAIN